MVENTTAKDLANQRASLLTSIVSAIAAIRKRWTRSTKQLDYELEIYRSGRILTKFLSDSDFQLLLFTSRELALPNYISLPTRRENNRNVFSERFMVHWIQLQCYLHLVITDLYITTSSL